jgi:hypothetical protein
LRFALAIILRLSAFFALRLHFPAVSTLAPVQRVEMARRIAAFGAFPAGSLTPATTADVAGNPIFDVMLFRFHKLILSNRQNY